MGSGLCLWTEKVAQKQSLSYKSDNYVPFEVAGCISVWKTSKWISSKDRYQVYMNPLLRQKRLHEKLAISKNWGLADSLCQPTLPLNAKPMAMNGLARVSGLLYMYLFTALTHHFLLALDISWYIVSWRYISTCHAWSCHAWSCHVYTYTYSIYVRKSFANKNFRTFSQSWKYNVQIFSQQTFPC